MADAIDVHTHILPPRWEDFATRFGGDQWPRLVGDPDTRCQLFIGQRFNRNLGPTAFDPARRIEDNHEDQKGDEDKDGKCPSGPGRCRRGLRRRISGRANLRRPA